MSKLYKKKSKKKVIYKENDDYVKNNNKSLEKPVLELPELNLAPIYHAKRRFTATSAVNGLMSIYQLFEQFRFAISSTTAYIYIAAVRIKRIRILASVATSSTPVTVSIVPFPNNDSTNNSFNSPPEVFSDTSSNLSVPAFVDVSPSKRTPLGSWHTNQNINSNLATFVAPSGAILDLDLEFILNIQRGPTYSSTTSGMTVGQLYAGTVCTGFVPVQINTI